MWVFALWMCVRICYAEQWNLKYRLGKVYSYECVCVCVLARICDRSREKRKRIKTKQTKRRKGIYVFRSKEFVNNMELYMKRNLTRVNDTTFTFHIFLIIVDVILPISCVFNGLTCSVYRDIRIKFTSRSVM